MECILSTMENMSSGAMVQRQIQSGTYMAVQPIVKNASVVEFKVDSVDDFIDLNKTELEVKFRIKKADGTNLEATDKVTVINYPSATLFNNVEVVLNGKTITHGTSNYAERAMMETILSYGNDAVMSWLQGGLFYKDTAGQMNNTDPEDNTGNDGLKQRAEFTKESKLVVTRGKLHLDIFNQAKPLINNCRMNIKFTKNKDAYCLMCAEDKAYKIEIEDMILWIRKLEQVQKRAFLYFMPG